MISNDVKAIAVYFGFLPVASWDVVRCEHSDKLGESEIWAFIISYGVCVCKLRYCRVPNLK